ncbi:hypothetical protein ACO2Q9_09740 [Variovorax sp. VNK109]|uniref:hypothetical protein n=1 Tax=Variovorax sp. VNK109 TaxID=3400919 RepID=UPI003C092E41
MPNITVKSAADESAALLASSEFAAAGVIAARAGMDDALGPLMITLQEQAEAIQRGDTGLVDAMFINQAVALQTLFFSLLQDAAAAVGATEKQNLTQLALRAQSGSRATLQSLMESKNPRHFNVIQQANVAHNQQVNNGAPPPAREKNRANAQNEQFVIESAHGSTTLDGRAEAEAGRLDQDVVTVDEIHRPAKRRRQGRVLA